MEAAKDMNKFRIVLLIPMIFFTVATIGRAYSHGDAPVLSAATRTVYGESKSMGNGVIQTWVKLDDHNLPTAIGVRFNEQALSGLPDTLPYTEFPVAFPPQAGKTPFTHFVANWNPKGHIPPGVYDKPHFDFHFYILPQTARIAITAFGNDLTMCEKAPADGMVPDKYIMAPGGAEPRMGGHWVDLSSQELNGYPFTITFVYGFYDGKMAFIEPMATRDFLTRKIDYWAPIRLPAVYPASGYYPTSYSLHYDPVKKEYNVALEGLTKR